MPNGCCRWPMLPWACWRVLRWRSMRWGVAWRGLAQAMGTLTKHGVKQVDRLLSNRGVDVWTFFAYWTPYIVGAPKEVVVALDWTSFAVDGQDTIVLSMLTGHGRATPLLWKTVASSTLKGNQRRYEYEVLCRFREVLPAGVKVTVVADRGFADCKLSRLRNSWGWRLGAVLNSPGKHPFALDRRLDAGSGGPAARREVEVGLFRRVADRASEHRWVTDAGRAPRGVAGGALVMSPGVRAGRR